MSTVGITFPSTTVLSSFLTKSKNPLSISAYPKFFGRYVPSFVISSNNCSLLSSNIFGGTKFIFGITFFGRAMVKSP